MEIFMYYTAHYTSPVGALTIAANETSITGLWIDGQKYYAATLPDKVQCDEQHPILVNAKLWLDRYFSGRKPKSSELSIAPVGSEFRQIVWKILCEIPYGEVITYGEIARRAAAQMGKVSMSAQAVGGAVGHNPISIIIPCHRVVGTNGSLTGYAGGIEKKIALLELEGIDAKPFFIPKKGTAL